MDGSDPSDQDYAYQPEGQKPLEVLGAQSGRVAHPEGPGYARVSVRPFIIVPLGAVSSRWLESVSTRFPVVHAVTVGSDNVEDVIARVNALPGEGVLVEVDRDAGAAAVRRLLSGMLSLDRRVRAFRNLALKTLLDMELLKMPFMESMLNPRIPYRDRAIVLAEGSAVDIRLKVSYQGVLSVDGQEPTRVETADRVKVCASEHSVRFARLQDPAYFYRNLGRYLNRNPFAETISS